MTTQTLQQTTIMDARSTSNCVWVDMGDTDGYQKEKKLANGKVILLASDLDYGGFDLIKRSGKVLNAPNRFYYIPPYLPKINPTLMSELIDTPMVEKDDIVFWEQETKGWCEKNGYKYQTEEGNFVYAVPYRFLICVVKKSSNQIVMVNGKVMVERDLSLIKDELKSEVLHIEKKYNNAKANWCNVINVNNNEGYSGTWENGEYTSWGAKGQYLEKGWQVLVKKYASFNLQSLIKEEKDIDELKDAYSVERKKIIAYRKSEEDTPQPYGIYLRIKLDENHKINHDLYEQSSSGLWLKQKKEPFKGTVVAVGCGVYEVVAGQEVMFTNKADVVEIIDGFAYIRQDWLLTVL